MMVFSVALMALVILIAAYVFYRIFTSKGDHL